MSNKLVGFVMLDGKTPEEGVPVVTGAKPIGRVTSARFSPTMGKGFGLAWVPVELAQDGAEIHIIMPCNSHAGVHSAHAAFLRPRWRTG
ncbi:Aminomethyltransferase [Geodia barretti]|uniref:Aminomethyltransferase n=1 Tax=Geodia barretti TaxID=519541 RepID=A0AA35WBD7_GEOBA|nr:Aminomethyltransferase [Geodia barretti]